MRLIAINRLAALIYAYDNDVFLSRFNIFFLIDISVHSLNGMCTSLKLLRSH